MKKLLSIILVLTHYTFLLSSTSEDVDELKAKKVFFEQQREKKEVCFRTLLDLLRSKKKSIEDLKKNSIACSYIKDSRRVYEIQPSLSIGTAMSIYISTQDEDYAKAVMWKCYEDRQPSLRRDFVGYSLNIVFGFLIKAKELIINSSRNSSGEFYLEQSNFKKLIRAIIARYIQAYSQVYVESFQYNIETIERLVYDLLIVYKDNYNEPCLIAHTYRNIFEAMPFVSFLISENLISFLCKPSINYTQLDI